MNFCVRWSWTCMASAVCYYLRSLPSVHLRHKVTCYFVVNWSQWTQITPKPCIFHGIREPKLCKELDRMPDTQWNEGFNYICYGFQEWKIWAKIIYIYIYMIYICAVCTHLLYVKHIHIYIICSHCFQKIIFNLL
jgi:DNA-directed RNA polymerase subunit RPC12/RpoP